MLKEKLMKPLMNGQNHCQVYIILNATSYVTCNLWLLLAGLSNSENTTMTIVKIVLFTIMNTITIVAGFKYIINS